MKSLLSLFLALTFGVSLVAQNTESNFIYFDFDKSTLTQESILELDRIITKTQQHSEFQLDIVGHTDQDGNDTYNDNLSMARAQEVIDYLAAKSIPREKMNITAHGEHMLFLAQDDESSKAKNRRVEIRAKYTILDKIEDLMLALAPEKNTQEHYISNNNASLITGDQGSTISIPANAFVHEDGSIPTGIVKLELIESFDFGSFAANGLQCTSDEKILETGGMMKLTASSDGKQLKLKDDKSIDIKFPPSQTNEDMKLFYGDSPDTGVSNWILSDSDIQSEQIEKDLNLDFELEQFLVERLDRPEIPRNTLTKAEKKPQFPRRPVRPAAPAEPSKDNISLNMGFWEKATTSKEEKQQLIDDKFQEKMTAYTKRKDRYEVLLERYDEAILNYKKEYKQTEKDIERWVENNRLIILDIKEYKQKIDRFRVIDQVWFAQNFLTVNIDHEDKEKIFLAFYDQLNTKIEKDDIRALYKYVFGPKYQQIVEETLGIKGSRACRYNPQIALSNDKSQIDIVTSIKSKANRTAFQYQLANGEATNNELGRYAMTISNLGWINCDRFYDYPYEQLKQLAILQDEEATFFLVFHDIRSMLSAKNHGNLYEFPRVPTGQKVTIVGLQVRENQSYLYTKELTMNENFKIAPQFRKSSLTEIKSVFDILSSKFSS